MSDIAAIIGAITGSISILSVAYFFGFRLGKIEAQLKYALPDHEKIDLIASQVETLWDVYVVSVLRRSSMNPPNPELTNPELVAELKKLRSNCSLGILGYTIISKIGVNKIMSLSQDLRHSFGETLAQMVTICLKEEAPPK